MARVRQATSMFGANRRRAPGLTGALADLIRSLQALMVDRYRPELHYMRGPGPKWHAKYDRAPVAVDERNVSAFARVNG